MCICLVKRTRVFCLCNPYYLSFVLTNSNSESFNSELKEKIQKNPSFGWLIFRKIDSTISVNTHQLTKSSSTSYTKYTSIVSISQAVNYVHIEQFPKSSKILISIQIFYTRNYKLNIFVNIMLGDREVRDSNRKSSKVVR